MLNVKTKSSTRYDEDESYKSVLITNKEKYFVKPSSIKCDGKNDVYANFGAANKSKILAEALKKKSHSENCCFPIARRRCRSESPPPPLLTDISTITQTAKLRAPRPENSAKCKKLLKCNGYSNKVLLFPEESWARTAASAYWTLSPIWWNCSQCKVVEVTGTKNLLAIIASEENFAHHLRPFPERKSCFYLVQVYGVRFRCHKPGGRNNGSYEYIKFQYSTRAKIIETDSGNLYIIGSFKKCAEPDFKLLLTSNITIADFNMGYCMTGSLERGSHQQNTYQTTHFAVIRRAEFNI